MSGITQDFRYALRMVAKQPAFTLVAVLTLALGIGANTAIFSVINAVLLRAIPYPHAERIMVLNESSGPGQDFSVALPDYFDWQKQATSFEYLACTHKDSRNLSGIPGRDPERVSTASVTRNFFDVVGLTPKIGRVFSEDEDKSGEEPEDIVAAGDGAYEVLGSTEIGKIERLFDMEIEADDFTTIAGLVIAQGGLSPFASVGKATCIGECGRCVQACPTGFEAVLHGLRIADRFPIVA